MKDFVSLNQNKDFKRAYYRGRSMASNSVVTYALKNHSNEKRFGITTSKKIGNAVQRNRARRVIKEAYRRTSGNLKSGFDVVFVARGRATKIKMDEVLKNLIYHFKKLGIWT